MTAAAMYDRRLRLEGAQAYLRIVADMGDCSFLWSRYRPLARLGETLAEEVRSVLTATTADVWRLRVVLDQLIDHAYAATLLSEVVVSLPNAVHDLRDEGSDLLLGTWEPFDPLRHALQQYPDESFNSFDVLDATCESAIHLTSGLSQT